MAPLMADLGRFGVWTFDLDRQPLSALQQGAAEIERLGFGALWVPEATGREALTHAALLLAATTRLVVANGIARIGARDARTMAAGQRALAEAYPGRHLLGLGGSNQLGGDVSPVVAMRRYLADMDSATYLPPPPVLEPRRVLGALGPAMLDLAAERAAGAHTYLSSPEHTAAARARLGPEPLLAVEQAVVLDTGAGVDGEVGPSAARVAGRDHLRRYLGIPPYRANFRRLGFDDDDLADGGSDRLVDAVVAWGQLDAVVDRLRSHLDAGADHVCLQVLHPDRRQLPFDAWRRLAEAVTG